MAARRRADARVLAAGADRDVSEICAELRQHRRVINTVREDMIDLRQQVNGDMVSE
jgi:hypothetical protein